MQINIQIIAPEYSCDLLSKKLLEENHNVVSTSSSYTDVLYNYTNYLPDIVLIDLDLDQDRGALRICRQIYNADAHAKVIAFAGNIDIATKSELFEIGVEFWHEKPLEMSRLFECIDVISKKYNLTELREKRGTISYDESLFTIDVGNSADSINESIKNLRNQIQLRKDSNEESFDTKDTPSFDLDFEFNNETLNKSYTSSTYSQQKIENNNCKRGYLQLPIYINDNNVRNGASSTHYEYTQEQNTYEDTSKDTSKKITNPLAGLFGKFKK